MNKPHHFFKNHYGERIINVQEFVVSWISIHPEGQIYVGTDSKVRGDIVVYATVICLWDVGRGVHEIFKTEIMKRPPDLYTRLWTEVSKAIEVAEILREIKPINVHIDINADPRYNSNRLYDASIGLINSLGFIAAGKPYSWAATSGANRHCK
ncbi:MAG: hypothetical protein EA412_04765 [Chitinophagaceae bacterium]|nr:MAG: hypothetical protein EA412_04765 [Chitinophagaceae bacterium]